jgi:ATP-binding cassette subfamily C (CFTR/MRP) protein 1
MRVRAGLITSIYQKALMLSSNERNARASGDIVNLMSVDTTRMQDLCSELISRGVLFFRLKFDHQPTL